MEINMRVTISQVREIYNGSVVTIYKDYGSLKARKEDELCVLYYDINNKEQRIAELVLTETPKAFQTKLNNYLASIHTLVEEELAEKSLLDEFIDNAWGLFSRWLHVSNKKI